MMTQNTIGAVLTALLEGMGAKKKPKHISVLLPAVHFNNTCLIASQNIHILKSSEKFVPTFYRGLASRHKSHLVSVRPH